MNENKPNYYAVIPANVRYDKTITANAKLLYGEITALCNVTGVCWASNDYFAELYGVSKQSISGWIKQLSDFQYIKTSIEYREGSKEILNRYIKLFDYPPIKNLNTPPLENLKDNITVFNTTINTIIELLNSVCKTSFKKSSINTTKHINARLKDGFTLEDFRHVICYKNDEWKNDEKMSQFLRPDTLFGTKFESYLQAAKRVTSSYQTSKQPVHADYDPGLAL